MKISDVTGAKAREVVTIRSDATVSELLALLAQHNIGAVVVSDGDQAVTGIVSERDVVRHLHSEGIDLLGHPVAAIMTTGVHTCAPGDDLADIAGRMTEHRVRHMPVVVDGSLVHIVSIGDIVKTRIDQLTAERDALESYIHQ